MRYPLMTNPITGTLSARSLERVRGEYLEMPGLCLTAHQAHRLWGLDLHVCRALLDALLGVGFLRRTHDGVYMRPNMR